MKNVNVILFALVIFGCKEKNKLSCAYNLSDILQLKSPSAFITYENDTVTEVKDRVLDTLHSTGLYTFDKNGILRFYGFFISQQNYIFSEEYDENGRVTKTEGTPVVEVRVFKQVKDTALINAYLFSLNRKYTNVKFVSNKNDTIIANQLFLSRFNTNIKCFSFKVKMEDNLTFRSEITWFDKCSGSINTHIDTTVISNSLFVRN